MADEPKIQDRHPEYTAHAPKWERIRDAVAGTDAIKAKGQTYLPKPEAMKDKRYTSGYLMRARWYDVTERTLVGLRGSMFLQEPAVDGDQRVLDQKDNLSARGLTFNGLARKIAREVLGVGRVGALLDPGASDPIRTMPKVLLYAAERITDWDIEFEGSAVRLTRVVLEEREGQNEKSARLQYRELYLNEGAYWVRLWQRLKAEDKYTIVEDEPVLVQGNTIDFIPFVFFGVNDLDPDIEKPPLLGLTDENIGHYQLTADYRNSLYLAGQPTPWVTGFSEKEFPGEIGASEVWASENPNAKVGMLEFTGQGIEPSRLAINDSEARMVLLGARFFDTKKAGVEAAEAIRLKFSADSATLQTISQTEGEGLERVLQWGARMAGLPEDNISVQMSDEFINVSMTSEELTANLNAWQQRAIAYTDLFALMKRGDIIAEGRSEEDVKADIETEAPTIPPAPPIQLIGNE